jgi:hypothetical protein
MKPYEEKRKHPRIDSLNLLSFLVTDENEDIVMQGVGRTLNVSAGGILLETHVPLDPKHTVSLFIALEDDLVDVKGRIIHTRQGEAGKYNTGIAFAEPDEPTARILKKFIEVFQKKPQV